METKTFLAKPPSRLWCFEDDELRCYEVAVGDSSDEVSFYNDGDLQDQWNSWTDFLDDCSELYLSIEDFKQGKQVELT